MFARTLGTVIGICALTLLLELAPARGQGPARPLVDADGESLPPGAVARLGTLRFNHDNLNCLAASADGQLIASGSFQTDGTMRPAVCLWDVATGKLLRGIKLPKEGAVHALAFSKQGRLAVAADDAMYIFDAVTAKPVATWKMKKFRTWTLQFSPSGKALFAFGEVDENGSSPLVRIQEWNVEHKKIARTWQRSGNGIAADGLKQAESSDPVALSAGGELLAWHSKGVVRLTEVATGKELWRVKLSTIKAGPIAQFSADAKLLALNTDSGIDVLQSRTGKLVRQFAAKERSAFLGHGPPLALTFSADGQGILAFENRQLRLREVATGKLICAWPLGGLTVLPLPKTSKIIMANGSVILLLDTQTGADAISALGHRTGPTVMNFSPDGKRLASACDERCVYWDTATWKPIAAHAWPRAVLQPLDQKIAFFAKRFAEQPDAPKGGPGDVGIYDFRSGACQCRISADKGDLYFRGISPDGTVGLLSSSRPDAKPTVRICDAATGKTLASLDSSIPDHGAEFSSDSKLAAWKDSTENVLIVARLPSGEIIRKIQLPGNDAAIAFSQDGTLVAVVCARAAAKDFSQPLMLHIWEVATGKRIRSLVTGGKLEPSTGLADVSRRGLAFSSDNRTVLVHISPALISGPPNALRKYFPNIGTHFFETASGTRRGILHPEFELPTCLAFSPDGKHLAMGSFDTTITIWDMRRPIGGKEFSPKPLTPDRLAACWKLLLSPEAVDADPSLWALVHSPKESLPFLQQHLKPTASAKPELMDRWIEELNNDKFKVRQTAAAELEKVLYDALPTLQAAARKPPSVEAQMRLQNLIAKSEDLKPTPEHLRQVRAVAVLEYMDSQESRQLLQSLAAGAPTALLTREAQAALKRLTPR